MRQHGSPHRKRHQTSPAHIHLAPGTHHIGPLLRILHRRAAPAAVLEIVLPLPLQKHLVRLVVRASDARVQGVAQGAGGQHAAGATALMDCRRHWIRGRGRGAIQIVAVGSRAVVDGIVVAEAVRVEGLERHCLERGRREVRADLCRLENAAAPPDIALAGDRVRWLVEVGRRAEIVEALEAVDVIARRAERVLSLGPAHDALGAGRVKGGHVLENVAFLLHNVESGLVPALVAVDDHPLRVGEEVDACGLASQQGNSPLGTLLAEPGQVLGPQVNDPGLLLRLVDERGDNLLDVVELGVGTEVSQFPVRLVAQDDTAMLALDLLYSLERDAVAEQGGRPRGLIPALDHLSPETLLHRFDGLIYLLLLVPLNLEGRKPTRGVDEVIDPQVHLVSSPLLRTSRQ